MRNNFSFSKLVRAAKLLSVFTVFSTALTANAEILFEGYYKVSQFKKHIGFLILRQEIDAKTNQFKITQFIRLGKNGMDMTESIESVSDSELNPISYNYLGAEGKTTKSITATFKNGKMLATATNGAKAKPIKIENPVPKGTFFSTALYYLMLKSKDGLKTDTKFDYQAIAEESAEIKSGTSVVAKKMVTQGPLQLLKVNTKFAGTDLENLITERGEVVSAIMPASQLETVLVKSAQEATEGVKVSSSVLQKLFGEVPTGNVNVYHAKGK